MRSTLSSIAVDVVHECAIIRYGLVAMLERLAGVTVCNQFETAADYADAARESKGDVAFVSTRVPAELERVSGLTGSSSQVGLPALVVVAPSFGDLDAREALQSGIKGLLLLSADPAELLAAARRVFMGNRYVMQAIAARVAEHVYAEPLTVRERQILEFLADGRCNKTIANELGIAVGTVKTHVKAVLSKLNVSSRTQAVVVATRRGLVRSEEQASESVAYASNAHDAGSPYASLRVSRDPTGEERMPRSQTWIRPAPLLAANSH